MKSLLKWLGIGFGVLVGLAVIAIVAIYAISSMKMNKTYDVQPAAVPIPTDAVSIAEGERLFVTRGCADCHGENLAGKVFIDDPGAGVFAGRNLTAGKRGVGAKREDVDWVRAIRHGIGPDGKPLRFMPSFEFYSLSDAHLGAIIAYIKSASPVDNEPPEVSPGPIIRALFLAGEVPLLSAELIDHDAPRPAAVTVGETAEYGKYLANGCIGCHGDGMSGGNIPGVPPDFPPAANITSAPDTGIGNWQKADFIRAIREGVRPDGSQINPFMPWPNFKRMNDVELGALWLYLRSLPAKQYGNR